MKHLQNHEEVVAGFVAAAYHCCCCSFYLFSWLHYGQSLELLKKIPPTSSIASSSCHF
uniref:Uncharacterized protein n=1 Tax=Octopus bimaculoides TaxID=37653 RepID=A0A0L8FPM7_OCTBM